MTEPRIYKASVSGSSNEYVSGRDRKKLALKSHWKVVIGSNDQRVHCDTNLIGLKSKDECSHRGITLGLSGGGAVRLERNVRLLRRLRVYDGGVLDNLKYLLNLLHRVTL